MKDTRRGRLIAAARPLAAASMLAAGAEPAPLCWWVDSPTAADTLSATLSELWPNAPVAPCLGAPAGDGVVSAGGTLTLRDGELQRTTTDPVDLGVAVALVRAWLRPARDPALALPTPTVPTPTVPTPTVPTPIVPAPTDPSRLGETGLALLGGPGLNVPLGGPPAHLAATAARSWRLWTLGALVTADIGAVLDSRTGTPVHQTRVGLSPIVGLHLPLWGGTWVETLGGGLRLRRSQDAPVPTDDADKEALLSVNERMGWWREVTPRWSVGLGLSIEVDDMLHAFAPPLHTLPSGTQATYPPYVAALEIGGLYRIPHR